MAIQCRITTEDPENHFIPDYGRISTYRSPGGFAVRLDGGNGFGGAVITPYFDSLLVKMTTWGQTLEEAVRRTDRSLREFRIRGVKTNIAFLGNLILHPTFMSGAATTEFVDSTPELFRFRAPRDRATKVLSYLGEVIVNGRPDVKDKIDRSRSLPTPRPPGPIDGAGGVDAATPPGLRQKLQEMGPEKFAQWVRAENRLLFTDTTMRDAHQSLLATRVRTYDLLAVAESVARGVPNLFSLEMWGGATFDTSMRFLQEDPWDRLTLLRARIPNILFQMLLRGSNAVGYTSYPDNVVREFIRQSGAHGIDVFRVFDSLNSAANMQMAMEAVRTETTRHLRGGDLLHGRHPRSRADEIQPEVLRARWRRRWSRWARMCWPSRTWQACASRTRRHALVKALRDAVDVPIHFHTHDTSGIQGASVLRAADAGVDIVDAALASMSGMTSQPCLNSLAAALRHTQRDSGLNQDALDSLSDYWAAVRELYYPFEEGLKAPTADVYRHEMPGGQFTNLRQQSKSLGLEARWPEVCEAYAAANRVLGDIVKVTPSSKVVGDLALFMVTNDMSEEDLLNPRAPLSYPRSVVEMLQGMLGEPQGGWPKAFQHAVLASARATAIEGRPGATMPPVGPRGVWRVSSPARLASSLGVKTCCRTCCTQRCLLDFAEHRKRYGDTSVIPTANFFYGLLPGDEIAVEIEEGKTLIIRFLTVGEVREDGTRTVFFELNGQPREVRVADRAVEATLQRKPKADPGDPNHIAAPMPGKVSTIVVKKGDAIKAGDRLLSIEAMKMETAVYSPRDAVVADVTVKAGSIVEAKDLLVILQP